LPTCRPWSPAWPATRRLGHAAGRRPDRRHHQHLSELLEAGDTIIDGGNTFYKDDIRRAKTLAEKGLHYIDVGTSGGVWGLERGYCMMIGGDAETVSASIRCSPPGAGHGRHSAHQGPQSDDPAPSTATSTPALRVPGISSR
jgi:hypothetical protein